MSKEDLIKECMEKCRNYIEEEMRSKWQMPMQMMGHGEEFDAGVRFSFKNGQMR
jgi:hypothetical protein